MLYLASELLAFFKKAILTILVSPPSDVVLYYFYFVFFSDGLDYKFCILQSNIAVNFNGGKPDVQRLKNSYLSEKRLHAITSPKACVPLLCIFSSRRWVGQWDTPGHAQLVRCSHTVLPCPCTLCCEGFHPSRNALPIMRVRGQSAAAPGGRDLPGTLSHWLCPYI